MESVTPPANDIVTFATPDPVAAISTAVGSPSAVPRTSDDTPLSGCDRSVPSSQPPAIPTILGVDTSTWRWEPPTWHPAGSPMICGKVTRKALMVMSPAVRVNTRV
jgi:hypothetical protein